MMTKDQKIKVARVFGVMYFLLLGIINFAATFILSELRAVDYIILCLSSLPVILRYRMFHVTLGGIGCFISLYLGMAGLSFNADPRVTTSQASFNMGYLLMLSLLSASILLIYSGINSPAKKRLGFA